MVSYDQAVSLIDERCRPLPPEIVPLEEALGRFTAEAVSAQIASPAFDNAAVDGFALGPGEPPFRVVGEIAAGSHSSIELGMGEAVRISTGAPVPSGAVAISMVEDSVESDGHVTPRGICGHIRSRAQDFAEGDSICQKGELITPSVIGLFASAGISFVSASRVPRVGLLTTGDELVPTGHQLRNGQIYNANAPMLTASLLSLGIHPVVRHLPDDRQVMREALAETLESVDVLVTCGAISVGIHDHLRESFSSLGVEQVFWGVRIKPGKPLYFGAQAERLVFGLPGNPLSTLVTYILFARPALLALMGKREPWPKPIRAVTLEGMTAKKARASFLRGHLTYETGHVCVTPAEEHWAGPAFANCLIYLPEETESVSKGDLIDTIPLS